MKRPAKIPWARLEISLFGICVVLANWRWEMHHFYTLPEYSVDAAATVTCSTNNIIGGLVAFMVTGHLFCEMAARFWSRENEEEKNELAARKD